MVGVGLGVISALGVNDTLALAPAVADGLTVGCAVGRGLGPAQPDATLMTNTTAIDSLAAEAVATSKRFTVSARLAH